MLYFVTSWLTPQKFIFTLILRSGKSQIKVSIVLNFLKISCIYTMKYDHIYASHLNVSFFVTHRPNVQEYGAILLVHEKPACVHKPTEWFSYQNNYPLSVTHFSVVLIPELQMSVFWIFFAYHVLYMQIFFMSSPLLIIFVLRTQLQDLIYPLSLYGKCCFKNKAKQPWKFCL